GTISHPSSSVAGSEDKQAQASESPIHSHWHLNNIMDLPAWFHPPAACACLSSLPATDDEG
ncbi:MAG: hypothetical protein AAFR78_09340, partial [Planctomycetota bacterium]